MPWVGFEPTISAGERPKTYALDRTATGTGLRTELQWGNLKERDYLENVGVDGRIILRWILNK